MKKLYTMLLLVISLCTASCSDWLDVSPSNQVNGDKLFEIGDGYRNALNGIYLNLGTSSMYGQTMSWGFMDAIAQYYKTDNGSNFIPKTSAYYKSAKFQFEDSDVKTFISNIWSVSYNNIANCNNLILNVSEASPSVFKEGEFEKNMIWGEALALRAFMHFDLLRLFAPAISKDDGKSYIPYVEVYPTLVPSYEGSKEILSKAIRDLKAAKELLSKCDITDEHKIWMSTGYRMLASSILSNDIASSDIFFAYRGYRMNYYAVAAILARVYYWGGEYELAYKEAKEVVEATYPNGNTSEPCFNFVSYSSLDTNLKDYNSIIMCFFNKTLQEDYIPYITKGNQTMFILDSDNIFASEEEKKEDKRFSLQTGAFTSNVYSLKYDIKLGQDGSDMIPGILLSEMYYIMGEYFARKSEYSQAGKMLDEVRYARGILTTNLEKSIGSLEGFHIELLKDMRKEFIGEGQLFFQYKRLDKKPVDNAIFVFDKPDNEDI